MFQYTMCMFVHLTHLVLSSSTLSNEIFGFISVQKSSCFCAFHNSGMNIFLQPDEKKSSMWMLVHCTHLVLSLSSTSYEIFCSSFLIKILHNSIMNFKTYPYLPVGICCIETPTNQPSPYYIY